MAFQSASFFVLLAAVLLVYFAVPQRMKNGVLVAAGVVFYAGAGTGYLVLLAVVVALSYGMARWMDGAKTQRARLVLLWVSLLVFFGNLCFFKYFDLFGRSLNRAVLALGLPVLLPDYGLLAPLGISFYTFVITGYLIDVYQRVVPAEKSCVKYAAFVTFFPLIASGPIERGKNMLAQFSAPHLFEYENFAAGTSRMLWGFFKKFVVANTLALYVDRIFATPQSYTGPYVLLGCLAYSYQIYCDFSGYSDIAIGVAQTLGFRVMENFTRPFAARSYTELWQRWHISLTSWFRDYVFTPLSFALRGSRWPAVTGALCLFVIFPLSGIWHGATLPFLVWGVLNGLYMVVGKLTAKRRRKLAKKNPLYRNAKVKSVLQIILVYLLFTSCIVFFRATDLATAAAVFAQLPVGWGTALAQPVGAVVGLKAILSGTSLLVLAVCIPLVEVVEWRAALQKCGTGQWMRGLKTPARMLLYYALLLLLACFGVLGTSSFIYFQF